MFQRNVLLPSSGSKSKPGKLFLLPASGGFLCGLFIPEDGRQYIPLKCQWTSTMLHSMDIPEDSTLCSHCCENFKYDIDNKVVPMPFFCTVRQTADKKICPNPKNKGKASETLPYHCI
jgi:hypothetical protein